MIPVSIEALLIGSMPDRSIIVLRPIMENDPAPRVLPICIGLSEAMSIGMALEGKQAKRPQSHDLMLDIIEALDCELEYAVIDGAEGMAFYSTLVLACDDENVEIDARPSDAIALAVRAHAPIYVETSVFLSSSLAYNPSRSVSAEREVEEFREYLEHVKPDDFTNSETRS